MKIKDYWISHHVFGGSSHGSKEELKERIELYLQEINNNPAPFRWKYGIYKCYFRINLLVVRDLSISD